MSTDHVSTRLRDRSKDPGPSQRGGVTRSAILAMAALVAVPCVAGEGIQERARQKAELSFDGSLLVDNPLGSVTITGSELSGIEFTAIKRVSGVDAAAAAEGSRQTQILLGGDKKLRIVKTAIGPPSVPRRWTVAVDYTIRVPRTVHVRIVNTRAEKLHVKNMFGTIEIENFDGSISIDGPRGPLKIQTVNGNIAVVFTERFTAHANLNTVNGKIEVVVPQGASFDWLAETLKGEILTTLQMRPIIGNSPNGVRAVRTHLGGPVGPILHTQSLTGRVTLLGAGSKIEQARSLTAPQPGPTPPRMASGSPQQSPIRGGVSQASSTESRPQFSVRQLTIPGSYKFDTSLGNIFIGEVRGDANVTTGAGEVSLGTVLGRCDVSSRGGPISLGDINGPIDARTSAGNIDVRTARKGGTLWTDGGNIEVAHAAGPVVLHSGGGDIAVRRAMSTVKADTRSGDIRVTVDSQVASSRIEAITSGGAIVLELPTRFGAEIDATIVTTPEGANQFTSDFPGLTVVRERDGDRIRIRASGRLNGGGERIELRVTNGDIVIRRR